MINILNCRTWGGAVIELLVKMALSEKKEKRLKVINELVVCSSQPSRSLPSGIPIVPGLVCDQ